MSIQKRQLHSENLLWPAAGVISAYLPAQARSVGEEPPERDVSHPIIQGAVPITLRINGKDHKLRLDPRTTLLDCIRETVALTGTKKGCDHGQCGACTVHVNGKRVLSCLNLALMRDGDEITTIEGLGTPEALHPMQAGFRCLRRLSMRVLHVRPDYVGSRTAQRTLRSRRCLGERADERQLCRCGAYANIVAAIQQVRKNA